MAAITAAAIDLNDQSAGILIEGYYRHRLRGAESGDDNIGKEGNRHKVLHEVSP
jgi:hypothetical protein